MRGRWVHYGVAVVGVALALALARFLEAQYPFGYRAPLFFVVLAVAWWGGRGPALVAAGLVLGAFLADFPGSADRFALPWLYEMVIVTALVGAAVAVGGLARWQSRAVTVARRLQGEAEAARAEILAAQQRQTFLAEASAILAASLDYETTLASVARLAVPSLADWCVVYMVDDAGTIHRLAVAHADPAKAALAEQLKAAPAPKPDSGEGVARVVHTGQPLVYAALAPGQAILPQSTPDQLDLMARLGRQALMIVPLVARDRTLGALSFFSAESGHRYGARELELAELLARRAAIAVDNARLYRSEQEAHAAAQAAVAARDIFLSVAAHELKTPMTSLRGYVQIVLRQLERHGAVDPVRLGRALRAVDEQSDRLARLVEQLLDVSRIDAGRLSLDPAPTDISDLIERVAAAAQARTNRHRLALQVPARVEATVDPLRFEQVVTNLVDNALKYSPDGGDVEVTLAVEPEWLRLTVRDHGIGVPPDQREHIFDRFYQAQGQAPRGGMGIGLFIAREIVELHGGQIEAEWPTAGGSRFTVAIPRRR